MRLTPHIQLIISLTKDKQLLDLSSVVFGQSTWKKAFRDLTEETPCIVGRKSWSILGRRDNIVLSSHALQVPAGTALPARTSLVCCRDIEEAMSFANSTRSPDISIIGGASVFEQFFPLAHTAHVFTVDQAVPRWTPALSPFPYAEFEARFSAQEPPVYYGIDLSHATWIRKL